MPRPRSRIFGATPQDFHDHLRDQFQDHLQDHPDDRLQVFLLLVLLAFPPAAKGDDAVLAPRIS
jgi:hypothetical protein